MMIKLQQLCLKKKVSLFLINLVKHIKYENQVFYWFSYLMCFSGVSTFLSSVTRHVSMSRRKEQQKFIILEKETTESC